MPVSAPVPSNASLSLILAAAVSLATALAACGPAAVPATGPEGATSPAASASSTPGAPATASTSPGPTSAPAGSAPRTSAKAPPGPMKPPAPTAMATDLQALGLDPAKLPALSKLEGEKLRRVMKLFTRALGMKCGDCHTEDFAAPTPMKNIAERMWDDYTRGLAIDATGSGAAAGAPVFCDSCHNGHAEFLDRHDKKALGKWMDEAYVAKLTRRDGKEHDCSTCHGDPFEGDILKEWARGPKAAKAAPASVRH